MRIFQDGLDLIARATVIESLYFERIRGVQYLNQTIRSPCQFIVMCLHIPTRKICPAREKINHYGITTLSIVILNLSCVPGGRGLREGGVKWFDVFCRKV